MTNLIEEVKSETRYENFIKLYKKSLVIIFVLCVVAVVFYTVYHQSKIREKRYSQEGFLTILDAKEDDSINLLDISNDYLKHHMSDLLVLNSAKLYLANGNIKKALEMFNIATHRLDYLPSTKAYAKLMWVSIMLDLDENISLEEQALAEKYFSAFANNRDCFFDYANILKALWLIKFKNNDEAKMLLQNILSDNNVNPVSKHQAKIIFESTQH